MQIKRFEAVDMTEALRLVKREFGDDAVILSAKEVRPRGFFSALRKKHVEITAAADYPKEPSNADNEFTGLLAQQLDDVSTGDRVSLTSAPKPKPLGTDGRRTAARWPAASPEPTSARDIVDGLAPTRDADQTTAGMMKPQHHRHPDGPASASPTGSAPQRKRSTNLWQTEPFFSDTASRRIIAAVGLPGAGKSTTLAKLAWHCRVVEKQRVALISLDRFRIAANGILSAVARIMNLPLSVVHNAGDLNAALNDLKDVDVVLIDTPGIGRTDQGMLNDVGSLLDLADPHETHLVTNAGLRQDMVTTMMDTFGPLGVTHLLPAHVDACDNKEIVADLSAQSNLPIAFYTDGSDLKDALKLAVTHQTTRCASQPSSAAGQVTAFPGTMIQQPDAEPTDDAGSLTGERYLANRNSELFHRPNCKSVKRINAENISAFDSIEQAINQGFKPCRSCCNVNTIRNAVADNMRYQRAGAM